MKIDTRSPMHDDLVPRRLLSGLEARVRLVEMGMVVVCPDSIAHKRIAALKMRARGAGIR